MTDQTKSAKYEVDEDELAKIRTAVTTKYGSKLKPGEALEVDVERDAEHAHVVLRLKGEGAGFHVRLEAAIVDSDEHVSDPGPVDRLYHALDFADSMMEEFLAEERLGRFHDDWRVYEFEGATVRFRGEVRRPDLEALADAWLSSDGNPEVD